VSGLNIPFTHACHRAVFRVNLFGLGKSTIDQAQKRLLFIKCARFKSKIDMD